MKLLFYFLMSILCLLVKVCPASAHTLYVFASGEGKLIKGQVYLAGGIGVPDAEIRVVTSDGKLVGKGKSDQKGRFTIEVPFAADLTVLAITADGHEARWNISRDEVSGAGEEEGTRNTAHNASSGLGSEFSQAGKTPSNDCDVSETLGGSVPSGDESLKSEISHLRTQIVQLREEWQRFRTVAQLRDILGGLGYIAGITGIAFYMLARSGKRSG